MFLSPKATSAETEVLAYDFYSLVGDVGGYLGLLLGVSLLTLFDILRDYVKSKGRPAERRIRRYYVLLFLRDYSNYSSYLSNSFVHLKKWGKLKWGTFKNDKINLLLHLLEGVRSM